MNIQEAYNILLSSDSTLDELLDAHTVLAIEQGYLLAIVNRESTQNMQLEPKLWRLMTAIEAVKTKIKNKATFPQL
ncbi:hypothetical protein QUA82_09955 [Microcoleus sp. F8-D3]